MFEVGSQVALNVKAPGVQQGTFNTHLYTGKVLRSESWHNANTVCITGDNPNVKVRIIPKEWVTAVDGLAYEFSAPPPAKTYTVSGSKGAVYEVLIDPAGHHKCSCASFRFKGGNCKHIQQLLEAA